MAQTRLKGFSWDFYSKLIIFSYCLFQILAWRMLPQFMDVYYHLLTAWGFIQAGGYTGWDFWEYAPIGRIHIYPPFLHIIFAYFMKLGIDKIILAKIFELLSPVAFLTALWYFIKKTFNARLAFFVVLVFSSSASFYLSLMNHLPSSLAFLFGIWSFSELLRKNTLRSLLLLALCFYTHIGLSWFFALSLIFYGLFDQSSRKSCLVVFAAALILSSPIILKQLLGLKFIAALGLNLSERFILQFKIIDYVLAVFGLILISRQEDKRYRLFLSFFLASLIFIIYPYRYFCAEGYFPIILLSALSLENLNLRFKKKYFVIGIAVFILFISPTLSMDKPSSQNKISYKLKLGDSAFKNMLFAKLQTLWFPQEYFSTANLIKHNSEDNDIIYSTLNIAGIMLSSISGRPTACALLPEIRVFKEFDPYAVSKIIIFAQDDDPKRVEQIIHSYKLIKLGENSSFRVYKNPFCRIQAQIQRASVSFFWIGLIGLAAVVFSR